jgi:FkbM family methyltransferase
MSLNILKPEYLYQPKIALRRLLPFSLTSNSSEFVEKKLPWGLNIRVRPLEEHGQILSRLGVIDLAVTETLWRLVEPKEIVVDVGANIGYMTAVLAARINSISGGCVWAFEAHPEIFAELKYNVENWQKQLQHTKFIIQNIAISEASGYVKLRMNESFFRNRGLAFVVNQEEPEKQLSSQTVQDILVESSCLDKIFLHQEIGVLKIDVEGHELQVLKGARKLLEQGKIRDCVFEEHREYPTPVTDFLETMGYTIFRIHRYLTKPALLSPKSKVARTHWQPTSFLATRDTERVIKRFHQPGWQVFSGRKQELMFSV